MIVTFKSAATADVIYFGDVAKRMMVLMGKEVGETGIVTVEQLPEAIANLKAAVAADRESHRQHVQAEAPGLEKAADGGQRPSVSLTQRAVPLLEMLEYSLKEGKPVTWGV